MKKNDEGTSPYWLENSALPEFSPLMTNEKADVCIIGGGISGLTCAYLLAKEKKKVIILEKGLVAGGETYRTTGHLANALDDRYYELERLFGLEGSRKAQESHREAINFIESIIKKEQIDCQFERLSAYLFACSNDSVKTLQKEYQAAKKAGIVDVKLLSTSPITTFNTGPCLQFPNQAQFHPLKYISKLAQAVQKKGVHIYTDAQAIEFKIDKSIKIKTKNGSVVEADQLVIATNSPIFNSFFLHTKQAAYRTYVIAGRCPKGYVPKGLYYDTNDPYHYIRIVELSPDEDLLMIGGEDHRTGQHSHPEKCFESLIEWSRERFPYLKDVEYQWSGQVMEPVDSLGFVGKSPGEENVYVITGDSGNGLTNGTIGGILISDLIAGNKNPWESIYDPSRITPQSLDEFILENFNTVKQYTDWIPYFDENSEESIPAESGAIISKGLQKLAVYKDSNHVCHTFSAVCPHLKGIVHWNSVEKSWDCPCHGSRFDYHGNVISGPAKKNLEKNPEGLE
jgi:glycine/D-amino acid oxidase-like deaminating enzyme/nitrite reductase/ring-hydroxylating ferredoxin subunit